MFRGSQLFDQGPSKRKESSKGNKKNSFGLSLRRTQQKSASCATFENNFVKQYTLASNSMRARTKTMRAPNST